MLKASILTALLIGFGAQAQETTFKPSGSIGVRYENLNNYDYNDDTKDRFDEFVQKTKLSMDIVKDENLSARLTVSNLMLWGDTKAFEKNETSIKGETTKSNLFQVEEAYGVYKLNEQGSLQFGRGQYLLGQGELISQRNYEHTPVTFDGILYLHELDSMRLSGFYVRGADDGFNSAEGSRAATKNDDSGNFIGATLTFKNVPDFLNDVLLHYVFAKSNAMNAGTIPNNERTWIGLSTTGETGMWDYHAAYIKFDGEATLPVVNKVDRDGSMIHLGVGANMPELMGLRVGVELHQDSGNKTAGNTDGKSGTYDPLYNDFKKYSGQSEIVKWGVGSSTGALAGVNGTGLTSIALRTKMQASDSVKLMLDYFIFEATEEQGNSDTDIGSEIDFRVEKSYATGFYSGLTYALFMPGDRIGANADDATFASVDFGFDF